MLIPLPVSQSKGQCEWAAAAGPMAPTQLVACSRRQARKQQANFVAD